MIRKFGWGAVEMIYRTMLHDLYPNGRVLERKNYKLLGCAYRVFLVGLSLDFLAFLTRSNTI